jgi:hypothetical protein
MLSYSSLILSVPECPASRYHEDTSGNTTSTSQPLDATLNYILPPPILATYVPKIHLEAINTASFIAFQAHEYILEIFIVSSKICISPPAYRYKNTNHQQMHKESFITHSYMFRPCSVIFRENFLLSLH